MALDFIGNPNNFNITTGDSLLAQNSRIYQLVTGKLPPNIPTKNLSNGAITYPSSPSNVNNTSASLYGDAEDIQNSIGALKEARQGLEMVMTRINVISELAAVIDKYPDMSYTQRTNINDQINFALNEIDDIGKTQKFSDTYLLDGTIEQNGAIVKLTNRETIDLTEAFKEVSPEKLGLPRQGEAFVRSDNLDGFYEQLSKAVENVQKRVDTIDSLESTLFDQFEIIKNTIYDTQNSIEKNNVFTPSNALGSNFSSLKYGGDLYLTMGGIQSSIMKDNDFYQRILTLLDKKNS